MSSSVLSIKHLLGTTTTCQFGNPTDTDWKPETHANIQVEILDVKQCEITKRHFYLVKKVGEEYVGCASTAPLVQNFADEKVQGYLYCTNARAYGAGFKWWTGIVTLEDAKRSLGF